MQTRKQLGTCGVVSEDCEFCIESSLIVEMEDAICAYTDDSTIQCSDCGEDIEWIDDVFCPYCGNINGDESEV